MHRATRSWIWALTLTLVAVAGIAAAIVLAPHGPDRRSPPSLGVGSLLSPLFGPDRLAAPPDQLTRHRISTIAQPDVATVALSLGSKDGRQAMGVLTENGSVCMGLFYPENLGSIDAGKIQCVAAIEFRTRGLIVDRGAWEVRWMPDGTVVWDGF